MYVRSEGNQGPRHEIVWNVIHVVPFALFVISTIILIVKKFRSKKKK